MNDKHTRFTMGKGMMPSHKGAYGTDL